MTFNRIAKLATAAVLGFSAPAFATVDQFPVERMTAIKVAFDRVLADPTTDVDRLSPIRIEKMRAAYRSMPAAPDADRLPPSVLAGMHAAYMTHGPDREVVALAD